MGDMPEILSDVSEMRQNFKLDTDGRIFSEGCDFKFS